MLSHDGYKQKILFNSNKNWRYCSFGPPIFLCMSYFLFRSVWYRRGISRDTGPISRDAGPSSRVTGPISRDAGPISRVTRPISRDTGPKLRDNWPIPFIPNQELTQT